MRVNGEIDALRAMGLDPVKYLVAPKLVAICVALPLLTVIADGLITLGGWLGCQLFLRLGTAFFLEQFRGAFSLADLAVGLVKSVLFALIIVLTAAHEGFNVPNRVAAIGEAARRAVLACVIAVLGADTVVNAVVYFIPRLGTV